MNGSDKIFVNDGLMRIFGIECDDFELHFFSYFDLPNKQIGIEEIFNVGKRFFNSLRLNKF